ncbi:MAG: PQQ-binding-like beta-propeller repeat protein [Geodermatophilaceae bacterium]|nr:PQQ-binding-like beta-propeller repeat protein [Geodermatophilaceae bacterium]
MSYRWRRHRRLLLWVAATVVGALLLGLHWMGSDYANTSLQTAGAEPVQLIEADPASPVAAAWESATGPADAHPVEDFTVVVGERHGVRGIDPETGLERWHYLRSSALLCDWTAVDGVVVAVFRTDAGCDEALALDAGTGKRVWYRNVNLSADVSMSSTNQLTVAATDSGVAVFGTTDNGLRWRYRPPEDCSISDTLPGDVGVAVTLDCTSSARLLLLDGFTGEERWTGTLPAGAAQILTADGVVGVLALDLSGSLRIFDRDGVELVSLREQSIAADTRSEPAAQLIGDQLAVFTGSTLFAVNVQTDGIEWVVPALHRPTLLGPGLLVYDGTDFVQHDLTTGAELRRISVEGSPPPIGGRLDRVGAAIVVSSPDGVAVYR